MAGGLHILRHTTDWQWTRNDNIIKQYDKKNCVLSHHPAAPLDITVAAEALMLPFSKCVFVPVGVFPTVCDRTAEQAATAVSYKYTPNTRGHSTIKYEHHVAL